MITRALALTVISAFGLAAAACSPAPELVIVNRSGRAIAFLPGMTVAPCTSVEMTRAQISAANAELDRWFRDASDPHGWVPPDSVLFQRGLMGAPSGAPDPMTVVFSSQSPPQIVHGFVPPDLPTCGGEPTGMG